MLEPQPWARIRPIKPLTPSAPKLPFGVHSLATLKLAKEMSAFLDLGQDGIALEELGIMLLQTRGVGALRKSGWHGSDRAVSPSRLSRQRIPYDQVSTGEVGALVKLLRSLIEDFGGEATSSSLCARVATHSTQAAEMRALLAQLESCGALSLEDLDGSEVIVRIAHAGALLAYE